MSATFQIAVIPWIYHDLVARTPIGWTIKGHPEQGPDGQMLVQVQDANAPAHVDGKRITCTLRSREDGTVTASEYIVLGQPWQGNRTPAEQGAMLERYQQVQEEYGDPLQVVAVTLRRLSEATVQAAEDRMRMAARIDELTGALDDVLRSFYERGHSSTPCIRTGWVREDKFHEWHQVLRGGS